MEKNSSKIISIQKHVRGFIVRKRLISKHMHNLEINRDKIRKNIGNFYVCETFNISDYFGPNKEAIIQDSSSFSQTFTEKKAKREKSEKKETILLPVEAKSPEKRLSLGKTVQNSELVLKLTIQKKIIAAPESLTEEPKPAKPKYIIKIDPSPQVENFELKRKILTTLLSCSIISKTVSEPENMKPLCLLSVIHKAETALKSVSASPKHSEAQTSHKKISILEDLAKPKPDSAEFLNQSPKNSVPKLNLEKVLETSPHKADEVQVSSKDKKKATQVTQNDPSSSRESISSLDEDPNEFIKKLTEDYHLKLDSASSSDSVQTKKEFKIRVIENPVISERAEPKQLDHKHEKRPKTQGKKPFAWPGGRSQANPEEKANLVEIGSKSLKKPEDEIQITPIDTFFSKRNQKNLQIDPPKKTFPVSQKPMHKFYPYEKKFQVLPVVSQPKTGFSSYKEFGFVCDLNNHRLVTTKVKSSQSRLSSSKSEKNMLNSRKVLPKFSPYRLRVLEKQYMNFFK